MKLSRYFLIIVIIFIIIFQALRWPFSVGRFSLPFKYFFSYLDKKIVDLLNPIFVKKNLLEENKKLSNELTRLIAENIRLKIIEEENERLRKEIEFTKKEIYRSILANIIGKKEEAGLTWFIIDQGSRVGIKKDFIATSEGVVVGKVAKTNQDFSYLLPLVDKRVKIGIIIASKEDKINERNRIEGIIKGRGGLIAEIDLLPTDKKIKNGDLVLTSGLEYTIPKGLFIGTIREIKTKPSDIFHKAIIELPKKLENIEMVSIIIPKIEE